MPAGELSPDEEPDDLPVVPVASDSASERSEAAVGLEESEGGHQRLFPRCREWCGRQVEG